MKAAWALLLWAAPAWAAGPRIVFDAETYDFGILTQGATVQHSFVFRNAGRAPLEVLSVNTSCGCTAALASDKVLPPGGEGRVSVTYDSRGKLGDVDKQVRVWSNDPERRMAVLTMKGRVVPSAHPEMTGTRNLFEESCAACHAAPARGKSGEALFNAACAMCHGRAGSPGDRRVPGAAPPEALAAQPPKALRRVIDRGLGTASMPAFARKRGGPLTKAQSKSLVDFLSSLKEE